MTYTFHPPRPLYSSPVLTSNGKRLPTRGPEVCRWIESNMRLGPGDFYGQQFKLTSYEKRWIYRLFEYYPNRDGSFGRFRYKRATLGTAKGNGKTPFEGALGAEGLLGPTASVSPLVLVAASSLGQSNLVFGDMRWGLIHDECPLKPFISDYDLYIELKDGPGEIKRVAAVAGSNDGPRATRFLADELHEWTGKLGDVFDILDGAIGKRHNAFTVAISTAGSDKNTKLGTMYDRGVALATGEIVDDESLFEWYEVPETMVIPDEIKTATDLQQWRDAIIWANPGLAEGGFLSEEYIRSRFDGAQQIERYKWHRYHANRWTRAAVSWLPPGKWADCFRVGAALRPGEEIVLAFSGTYDGDAAGLVAVRPSDGFQAVVGVWEPPPGTSADLYEVPRDEARALVRSVMDNYKVLRMVVNPNGWHSEAQEWTNAYGEKVVVTFDWTHQVKRKHDACSLFFTSVLTQEVTHDGNPAMGRHLESATLKETAEGAWITQQGRNGPPIALAVAGVLSWDQAVALRGVTSRSKRLVTF